MKRTYELVVVFEPEAKAEESEKLLTNLQKNLTEKVKVIEEKDWGKKELAYPLKKKRLGLFHWWKLEAEGTTVVALEKKLKLEEKLLRYLIIRE